MRRRRADRDGGGRAGRRWRSDTAEQKYADQQAHRDWTIFIDRLMRTGTRQAQRIRGISTLPFRDESRHQAMEWSHGYLGDLPSTVRFLHSRHAPQL